MKIQQKGAYYIAYKQPIVAKYALQKWRKKRHFVM